MATETKAQTPPYGVFATLKNSIEQLAQGIPNQIDRSVFPGMAWNAQNQLMIGLRFLGLIDENGKPTSALHELAVTDEARRKAVLAGIVRVRYSDLFALDLMRTTPAELDQRVTEFYGITGDTREKAVRFFLSVLAYLDIPVSPLFSRTRSGSGSNGAPRRRRVTTRPRVDQQDVEADEDEDEQSTPTSGTSRTITLRSGGELTLSASIDLFRLNQADRKFVFALIDKLEEYEAGIESETR